MNKEKELTPLMQQYHSIKSQYPDIILFFRLGDFYEMFGDDAVKAHPILEVVLTKRQDVPMCGIPFHSANNYIRKLVKAGLKIAICEQLEEPTAGKGIVKRGVVKVITPGTVLEDNLLDSKLNNYLMSIILDDKSNTVSIAITDISTGDFFTYEINFSNLENEIIKYKPNEIIVSQKTSANEQLQKILQNFNIVLSPIKDIYVDSTYCENLIKKILKVESIAHFNIADKTNIISAVGAIFVYIQENQPQSLPILNNVRFIESNDFMVLDAVAIKNLEILRSLSSLKQEGSLLSAIDTTITPMGARLLRNWIIKPLLDIKSIENRQFKTKLFVEESNNREELREDLKSIYDLDRIVSRIVSGSASPKELLSLKDSLVIINNIYEKLTKTPYFKDNECFKVQTEIINKIESYIEPETPILLKDGNVIKSNISQELDELRLLSKDAKKYISELEIREKQKTGINNLKIGYTSVFGYYLDVTKSNIPLVPETYIRKQTLTNSERYITQELKTLEEKIISAQDKIIKLETEIFVTLRQEIASYSQHILLLSSMIAELDIYLSFAQNAIVYNYSCPVITNDKDLILKDARHPVVEQILKDGFFVANDISLNDTTKRIMILTGPNMSGKSTYLRQVALIIIMAQIGSFVPCSNSTIGIVDRIFTRIGAGDNLVGGESTFMVEMTETANILNQYTDRSLIILDEVGRGTSTYDGMSIAWAILEFFSDSSSKYNKGAKILFATHYFELTTLANPENGIINASVDVKEWNDTVIFLHKIVDGAADKSYGIHVAKIAGIPYKVIKRAYEILKGLEKNLNKNFSKLEQDVQPNLFTSIEPEILIELRKLNIDNLKPIEALKLLSDWKEKFKK
ncbi:MAG: DNA mismatch repair protein MutS [Endomicrobiaceae bacterium]|nr:DNA mismatch repair protein MutS [Endomicrobiaceae bacterium]MDD3053199.1 DNA mismatch repair protein MutS [Endomicrobiaceae bacterium]MDD3922028.1 DNA mismatch repair protein MutS [Endomicrobiaceae bacterium]